MPPKKRPSRSPATIPDADLSPSGFIHPPRAGPPKPRRVLPPPKNAPSPLPSFFSLIPPPPADDDDPDMGPGPSSKAGSFIFICRYLS